MKIITIIGTRPQYIKLKPFYDYCKNNNINNIFVDTLQHYSSNVSSVFINEFNLEINHNLKICNETEKDFISDGIRKIYNCFEEEMPDVVLVLGDTNTTLCSSLVANKMGIPSGHIEAGIRCNNRQRPEEINRIVIDDLTDIHFTSREKDNSNVRNPVYVGDLEYILLNQLNKKNVCYDDFLLMTIHRQENLSKERIKNIFKFCEETKEAIIFSIHHRTKKIIKENNLSIPENIIIYDPLSYGKMVSLLNSCGGIITDSGGVIKISPFFGKKCIIPLEETEWDEVVAEGYAILGLNHKFLKDRHTDRKKDFYLNKDCCEKIIKSLKDMV